MYEYLKALMPVAELIGTPVMAGCYDDDSILGNRVVITGTTVAGYEFHLELRLEDGENA